MSILSKSLVSISLLAGLASSAFADLPAIYGREIICQTNNGAIGLYANNGMWTADTNFDPRSKVELRIYDVQGDLAKVYPAISSDVAHRGTGHGTKKYMFTEGNVLLIDHANQFGAGYYLDVLSVNVDGLNVAFTANSNCEFTYR